MGVVYLVLNHKTGRHAALKTVRDEYLNSINVLNEFVYEANLWFKPRQHPNIIPALSLFNYENRPYVERPYVTPDYDGRVNLRDHISSQNKDINIKTIVTWSLEFCSAMEHAQQNGMKCHRDIKPENLLLDKWEVQERQATIFSAHKRVLKISDFGIAKSLDKYPLTQTQKVTFTNSETYLSLCTIKGGG